MDMMDTDGNEEVTQQEFINYFVGNTFSNMKILSFGKAKGELAPPGRRGRAISRAAAL